MTNHSCKSSAGPVERAEPASATWHFFLWLLSCKRKTVTTAKKHTGSSSSGRRLKRVKSEKIVLHPDGRGCKTCSAKDNSTDCIIVTEYASAESGGMELPAMPSDGVASLAAVVHVGADARIERSPSGDLFIYARQGTRIDEQLEKMLA